VLHHDLSENNLIKLGEGDVVKDILNDCHMVSHVEANNEIQLSTATHRTGTIPFMAQDLLVDSDPPPHLYRHDLESFFTSLFGRHFTMTSQKRNDIRHFL